MTPCELQEFGKPGCVRLSQHRVTIAAVRPEIHLGAPRHRSPAQHYMVGAQFSGWQEQVDTARKMPRHVARQRREGGALDLGAQDQHLIRRRGALGVTLCPALTQHLGDVQAALPEGARPQLTGVVAYTPCQLREATPCGGSNRYPVGCGLAKRATPGWTVGTTQQPRCR